MQIRTAGSFYPAQFVNSPPTIFRVWRDCWRNFSLLYTYLFYSILGVEVRPRRKSGAAVKGRLRGRVPHLNCTLYLSTS